MADLGGSIRGVPLIHHDELMRGFFIAADLRRKAQIGRDEDQRKETACLQPLLVIVC